VTDETNGESAKVLIVEDENELADLYATYLGDIYSVETVYSGQDALDRLDEEFDVVLLDRRMPVVSGTEVLANIEDAGLDCRIAMVTAINPDFDIIDLRIDDYLVKPITRQEVRETVQRLLKLEEYNERMQKLTSKKLKRNVLELEKTSSELGESPDFNELTAEIESLETEIESIANDLDIENLERHM